MKLILAILAAFAFAYCSDYEDPPRPADEAGIMAYGGT